MVEVKRDLVMAMEMVTVRAKERVMATAQSIARS